MTARSAIAWRSTVTGAVLVLFAVLLALYRPALGGPFVLDDAINIPQTRLATFDPGALWTIVFSNESGPFGRPISVLTFALNQLFGDGSPASFKWVNLALHAANVCLVYALCHLLLRRLADDRPRADGADGAVPARATALAIAAVWAVHPMQVSTVMYVVQRMTLLMSGFTLLALLTYAAMRCRQIERDEGGFRWLVPVLGFTLLACLSKENGVLVGPYVLLLELVVFRFRFRRERCRKPFALGLAALTLLSIAAVVAAFLVKGESLMGGYATRDFDWLDRLRTQPAALIFYIEMTFLPDLSALTLYHDDFPVRRVLDARAGAEILFVLGLFAAVPLLARRAPVVSLGLGLFLVSQLLESTFLPLELVFEHRNYLGMVGLLMPLAWHGASFASRLSRPAVPSLVLLPLFAVLAFQTHARALEWSSAVTLNAIAAQSRPGSIRAQSTLAVVLTQEGRADEALRHLDRASAVITDDAYLPLLAVHIGSLSGVRDEAALERAGAAVSANAVTTDVARVLSQMRDVLRGDAGGSLLVDDVISLYEAALGNPDKRLSAANQAVLHVLAADVLMGDGRFEVARGVLRSATALDPESPALLARLQARYADND